MKYFTRIILLTLSMTLVSCAPMHKTIKHRNLEVQTKMTETVFLNPVSPSKKILFVDIRNTSDKKNMIIKSPILAAVIERGYKITQDPAKANFLMQVNILQVGKYTPESADDGVTSALTGVGLGGISGAALGRNSQQGGGMMLSGAIAGGLIGIVADAMVNVNTYTMITDIQLSERINGTISEVASLQSKGNKLSLATSTETSNWKKHQTKIVSTAKKVNLKYEQAEADLKKGLIDSLSGIL